MDAVEEIYAAFPPGQYHVMIDYSMSRQCLSWQERLGGRASHDCETKIEKWNLHRCTASVMSWPNLPELSRA
jgi:hypothetical protein